MNYPSEVDLEYIRNFKVTANNLNELFVFIKSIWEFSDMAWSEKQLTDERYKNAFNSVRQYSISTCGWSGNEDIIDALRSNTVAWMMSWYISKRGGHFIFRVSTKLREIDDD